MAYVDDDRYHFNHSPAHDAARDAELERLLIRLIGLDNLVDRRNREAGRVPDDTHQLEQFLSLCVNKCITLVQHPLFVNKTNAFEMSLKQPHLFSLTMK